MIPASQQAKELEAFLRTLRRHGRLVAAIALAPVALTAAVIALKPKVYESRVILQIGRLRGDLVEKPSKIFQRIQEGAFATPPAGSAAQAPSIIARPSDIDGRLTLQVRATTPGRAATLAADLARRVVDEYAARSQEAARRDEEYRQSLYKTLLRLSEEVSALRRLAPPNDLKSRTELVVAEVHVLGLLRESRLLAEDRALRETYATRIVSEATRPERPVHRLTPALAAFAGLAGLMAAILAVLLLVP